jgi:large subunit ribosomal protein L5
MIPRLKLSYDKEILKNLMSKLNLKNRHEVPKIHKIILNMGLGEDASDGKKIKACVDDMALITGQKPVITKFKQSISNFKTRKGSNAGIKVTLRSHKMYEFIDRLVNIALPRIKDFRGLNSRSIDDSFNYSFGIKEHIIFPEVNFDKVDKIRGLDITIVTTSKSRNGTLELLKEFNFPIQIKKSEVKNG